ncbi:MAG: hypothetical protein ABW321_12520 [Polyangiales bacterium]
MSRLALLRGVLCVLAGCQYMSGLDDLELAPLRAADAGEPPPPSASDAGCGEAEDACDPVAQCGCSAGLHCQLRGSVAACFPVGNTPLGAVCEADDECAAGSGCIDRLCRRYCASDGECGAGVCQPGAAAGSDAGLPRGCTLPCDFASNEGCGEGAQCARSGELGDETRDVCVAPTLECRTDQRCDEPAWGTRLCAAGSDAVDCSCEPQVPNASCDLFTQCGCSPGQQCVIESVDGASATLRCAPSRATTSAVGERCAGELDCPAGHSCWRGLCEKHCLGDADCPGKCLALTGDAGDLTGVRVCSLPCTFDTEAECAAGSRCIHAPEGQDYCFIPRSPCPFAADGTCDESRGTRICEDGTDGEDCL